MGWLSFRTLMKFASARMGELGQPGKALAGDSFAPPAYAARSLQLL